MRTTLYKRPLFQVYLTGLILSFVCISGALIAQIDEDIFITQTDIFEAVDEYPMFPGCSEKSVSINDLQKCSQNKLWTYFYNNVRLPEEAIQNNIKGYVSLECIILKDGTIADVQVIQDIGFGCGEAVAQVFMEMEENGIAWEPAKSRDKNVNAKFTQKIFLDGSNPNKVYFQNELPITPVIRAKIEVSEKYKRNTRLEKKFKAKNPDSDIVIYIDSDKRPRFPGCENMEGIDNEKDKCAKDKMQAFIKENLKYPPKAWENNITGAVVIQFTVTKEGRLRNFQIPRDIGYGSGKAARDVFKLMNEKDIRWSPGIIEGEPVEVLYTAPVYFKKN